MNPLKKAILDSRKRAEAARLEYYHASLNVDRVSGKKMKPMDKMIGDIFVVFTEAGELVYKGNNAVVARLVASCFEVGVY